LTDPIPYLITYSHPHRLDYGLVVEVRDVHTLFCKFSHGNPLRTLPETEMKVSTAHIHACVPETRMG